MSEPLAAELALVRRRGAGFLRDEDLRRAPLLVRLASVAYGSVSPSSVRRLLATAAESIGEPDLRAACQDLFGLTRESAGKSLPARQELACRHFDPRPAVSTFRQQPRYAPRIIDTLAGILEGPPAPLPASVTRAVVPRDELTAAFGRVLGSPVPVVVVHGEAGMGKSELAMTVPRAFRVRLTNPRVAELDTRELLIAAGQPDTASLSDAACLQRLRAWVAEPGRETVVLDNAATVEDAELYLPPVVGRGKKVIITSRNPLAVAGAVAFPVSSYTASEAAAAVRLHLPVVDDELAGRIAEVLALHPLAIDHVCRYVAKADPVHVLETVAALNADAAATLSAIESSPVNQRRLTATYRSTLRILELDGPEVTALDLLLALGNQGSVGVAFADDIMRVQFPGAVGQVGAAAQIRNLIEFGLLTTDDGAYGLHPLTATILAGLRRPFVWKVLHAFMKLMETWPEEAPTTMGAISRELRGSAGLMASDGQGAEDRLVCLNRAAWLHVRHREAEETLVRYLVRPRVVLRDSADESSRPVTLAEGKVLYHATNLYQAVSVYPVYRADPAMVYDQISGFLLAGKTYKAEWLADYAYQRQPEAGWVRQCRGIVLCHADPVEALRMLRLAFPPPYDGVPPADLYDLAVALALNGEKTETADVVQHLDTAGGAERLGWQGWRLASDGGMRFTAFQTAAEVDQALAEWSERAGNFPATVNARMQDAQSRLRSGATDLAVTRLERIVADSEAVLGPDDRRTLMARSYLADSHRKAGRISESAGRQEQVVADMRRVHGADHPDTFVAEFNLSAAYSDAGRIDAAISLHEDLVVRCIRVLGPEFAATLTIRAALAVLLQKADRASEAVTILEEVRAARERTLGPNHLDTLTARADLAHLYRQSGRVDEAIALLEPVVAGREQIFGPDHLDTFTAQAQLAVAYGLARRLDDAIALEERVVAGFNWRLGRSNPATLTARKNLAAFYREAGRPEDALALENGTIADRRLIEGRLPASYEAKIRSDLGS